MLFRCKEGTANTTRVFDRTANRFCEPCHEEKVKTADGGCSSAQILARVQSGSLEVKLCKQNRDLIGNFDTPRHQISLGPSGKYELNWTLRWDTARDWVHTESPVQIDEYTWNLPLSFNASNMSDGTEVNATLRFEGQTGRISALPGTVRILARVESTPSFEHSTMQLPATVALGKPVSILITAHDVDGIPIHNTAGRFFVVSIKPPDGKIFMRSSQQDFELHLPPSDLRHSGEYEVHQLHCPPFSRLAMLRCRGHGQVWITKAFGFDVNATQKLPTQLPTERHRLKFSVDEAAKTDLHVAMGVAVGVVLALCVVLLLFFVVKHPSRAKVPLKSVLNSKF